MPVCVEGMSLATTPRTPGLSPYIPVPFRNDPNACTWVLQTGNEFAEAQAARQELEAMFLPCILVVIFVLGWIAGAQR